MTEPFQALLSEILLDSSPAGIVSVFQRFSERQLEVTLDLSYITHQLHGTFTPASATIVSTGHL